MREMLGEGFVLRINRMRVGSGRVLLGGLSCEEEGWGRGVERRGRGGVGGSAICRSL